MPVIVLSLVLAGAGRAAAQEPDSLSVVQLDSTVFSAERHESVLHIGVTQPTTVQMAELKRVPLLLGTADPIRFVRLLPGVQTGMELDAGLHVQGTENAHSLVSVEGVPVYGVTHVLGLFSTFIPSHYREMNFSPFTARANRLGGSVDMRLPDKPAQRLRGNFTVGLFESEGTLDVPLGKKASVFASARRSYINLLYGKFLRLGQFDFRYGFDDFNLTFLLQPGPNDRIWADGYYGTDDGFFQSGTGAYEFMLKWSNQMGAVHHLHNWDEGQFKQTAYYTGQSLTIDFQHDFYSFLLPSSLSTAGYKASLQWGHWYAGADVAWHWSLPQRVEVRNKDLQREGVDESQQALEATAELRFNYPLNHWLELEAGVKGIYWRSVDGAVYPAVLPEGKAVADLGPAGKLELLAGMARQNLFQTGISSMGLPTEFWFIAGKDLPPQGSTHVALSWGKQFMQERYALSASVYYRHLSNQLDYDGTVIDYLEPAFKMADHLLIGGGRNYGLCLIAQKQSGAFTGWIAYTLSRSLRTFGDYTFPSNHERIHECNVVLNYNTPRWTFGGVMVAASGTPFTGAEAFYVLGGTLVTDYTLRNACRAKPYFRFDISATYYFRRTVSRETGLSFSLYNASGYRNDVFRQLEVKEKNGEYVFSYQPLRLHIRFLPSLSFFHSF